MEYNWTGLIVFGILVYGLIAINSPDISFNLSLALTLFLVIFVCETIANIVMFKTDNKKIKMD